MDDLKFCPSHLSVCARFYSNRARKDHSCNLAPAFCIIRGLRMYVSCTFFTWRMQSCDLSFSLSLFLSLSLFRFFSICSFTGKEIKFHSKFPMLFLKTILQDPTMRPSHGVERKQNRQQMLYSRLVLSKHGRRLYIA